MGSDETINIGQLDGEDFDLPVQKLITGRTAVIGQSGSGKSHLIGVLCEEVCEAGYPFVVIDPEGEYYSLKQKYEVVWACNSEAADVRLGADVCRKLAHAVVKQGARLVFDTSESKDEFGLVSVFLTELYALQTRVRSPMLLIVEEADRFAPQSGGEVVSALHEISRRGRKRGLGLTVATQRPAMVDKNVLSQCGSQLIGRLRSQNDHKAVKLFFQSSKTLARLPELDKGDFFVMGEFTEVPAQIHIRGRKTTHAGATPEVKRGREFRVADLLDDMGIEKVPDVQAAGGEMGEETEGDEGEEPEEQDEGEAEATRRRPRDKAKGAGTEKKREGREKKRTRAPAGSGGGEVWAIPFRLSAEDALKVAQDDVKKSLLTRRPVESIEKTEAVYWPVLACRIEEARRGMLKLKVKSYQALWDPILTRFLNLKGDHDLEDEADMDPRVAGLNPKEIRVLRELTRNDMTNNDLAPKTALTVGEVKSATSSLRKKKLVTDAGKVGNAILFRPLVTMKAPKLRELNTDFPSMDKVAPQEPCRLMAQGSAVKQAENIISGLHKEARVTSTRLFYVPYYLTHVRDRKKGTVRIIRVNGASGSREELEGWMAEAVGKGSS